MVQSHYLLACKTLQPFCDCRQSLYRLPHQIHPCFCLQTSYLLAPWSQQHKDKYTPGACLTPKTTPRGGTRGKLCLFLNFMLLGKRIHRVGINLFQSYSWCQNNSRWFSLFIPNNIQILGIIGCKSYLSYNHDIFNSKLEKILVKKMFCISVYQEACKIATSSCMEAKKCNSWTPLAIDHTAPMSGVARGTEGGLGLYCT